MGIHRQRGAHVSPSDEDTHSFAWVGHPQDRIPSKRPTSQHHPLGGWISVYEFGGAGDTDIWFMVIVLLS